MLCQVYILSASDKGPVKIGISDNAAFRARAINTASPTKVSLFHVFTLPDRQYAKLVESELHYHFSDYRQNGEWFDVTPEKAVLDGCGIVQACLLPGNHRQEDIEDNLLTMCGANL